MTEDALDAALDRLDRAVARLEQIDPPVASAATDPDVTQAYAALDERHGLLRLRIQEAIERLDSLIAHEHEETAG